MIRGRLAALLSLSVASFTLCLLLVESVLRLAGFDPMADLARGRGAVLMESEDPVLAYELRPHASGFGWDTQIEVNAHGMRDRPRDLANDDAYRIVALGDSVTFGSGVEEEERFSNRLEALLTARSSHPVEVLNFGVGGYDTLQAVASLERKGLRFDPDLVLLAYCFNDVGNNSPNLQYIRRLEHYESPWFRLRTVQLVTTVIDRIALSRRLGVDNEDAAFLERNEGLITPLSPDPELDALRDRLRLLLERTGEDDFRLPWYLSDAHLARLEFALTRLQTLSEEQEFPVTVAILPVLEEGPAFEAAYAIAEHMARKRGFEVISLLPILDGIDPRSLRLNERDTIHPNARGHRLIAAHLARPLSVLVKDTAALSR